MLQPVVITLYSPIPTFLLQLWVMVMYVLEDAPLLNSMVALVAPHLHLVTRHWAQ